MKKYLGTITTVSCGINGFPDIKSWWEKSKYIFGSSSLLAALNSIDELDCTSKNIVTIGALARDDAKYALDLAEQGEDILVLCSGDALYNGFGGTLSRLAHERGLQNVLQFYPHITAFQALFHKLGRAWEHARFFTAHYGKALAVREMVCPSLSVIYGGTTYPAHVLAKEIMEFSPYQSNRDAVAAEFLGDDRERIVTGTIADLAKQNFAPTSILLLLPNRNVFDDNISHCADFVTNTGTTESRAESQMDFMRTHCLNLGLPESIYAKENNLITASDARAICLSRLRLPQQESVMWDLGAGSGSVGLEAASLCPCMHVHAIEQNENRIPLMEQNRKTLGIVNYTAWHGDILTKIEELDAPHRIFIGGGGKGLVDILDRCAERLLCGGIMVVSAVTLESFHALHTWLGKNGLEKTACIRVDIALEECIANVYHSFKPQNTLYIFTYVKQY